MADEIAGPQAGLPGGGVALHLDDAHAAGGIELAALLAEERRGSGVFDAQAAPRRRLDFGKAFARSFHAFFRELNLYVHRPSRPRGVAAAKDLERDDRVGKI